MVIVVISMFIRPIERVSKLDGLIVIYSGTHYACKLHVRVLKAKCIEEIINSGFVQ